MKYIGSTKQDGTLSYSKFKTCPTSGKMMLHSVAYFKKVKKYLTFNRCYNDNKDKKPDKKELSSG